MDKEQEEKIMLKIIAINKALEANMDNFKFVYDELKAINQQLNEIKHLLNIPK